MAEAFPRTVHDITPAWLSQVLGATVTSYDTVFLEGGVLADAFKLQPITYEGNAGQAPASVVVKIANQVKERRDFARLSNAYSKELHFFMELAQDVPLNVPKMYGCFTDGSPSTEYFIMVMEDLTAHSKVFDQVDAQYHEALLALHPAAASYTYDMLLEDYTLSYCFWWTAIITIGVGTLPLFDKPEGLRMQRLWSKALPRATTVMIDLDCLSYIKRLAVDLPDDPPPAAER